ncbi:universal stress protein [Streptosporangium sp. KLBMP 9127]|nr:universal stress protein [Streptosporangium sp. KLBMP 9127]
MSQTSQPRIVVGFSHSIASASALLWAIREAQLRGAVVEPVHAWQWSGEGRASYAPMDTWRCPDDEQSAITRSTALAISELAPGLRPVVLQGPAVQVLLHQAEAADLLILGSRPFDPDTPATVGPVVGACLVRAPCPVVVVSPDVVPAQRARPRHLAYAGIPPRPGT